MQKPKATHPIQTLERSVQRQVYQANITPLEARLTERLSFGAGALITKVRRAFGQYQSPYAPAQAADQWLLTNLGQRGDRVRRAAVATLALSLTPDALSAPSSVLALYPDLHGRLTRFLGGSQPYDDALFARDISLVAGAATPMGSFSVGLCVGPSSWSNARLAAPVLRRHILNSGARGGLDWILRHGRRPWAVMQLDTRNARNLSPRAFQQSCHRLAAMMELNPGCPGVIGLSWLFDPELESVSPKLAFLRRIIEAGGGEFSTVDTQSAQITDADALKREFGSLSSPGFRPRWYRLLWAREDIHTWRHLKGIGQAPPRAEGVTPRLRTAAGRLSNGLAQA